MGHLIDVEVISRAATLVLFSSQNTKLVGLIPAPLMMIISFKASAGPLCGKGSPVWKKVKITFSETSE